MPNFYKLNLPSNPLNPLAEHKVLQVNESNKLWFKSPMLNTYSDPDLIKEVLAPEVFDQLIDLGLEPALIVVFFMTKDVPYERSFIHRDYAYNGNKWVTVPFGINFEVNPTTTSTVTWWNTEGHDEYGDDTEEHRILKKNLMAFRFHKDHLRSTPKYLNLESLDSITIPGNSTSILFRTDVAHSVVTNTLEGTRFNVSLRFDINKVSSFDTVVEKLKPIML